MQINDKAKIDARIAGAFKAAADATGASFDQLARTAARESDLRPDLASSTSSAKGLFQFVDQTWYELIKKEGASVGLDRLAEAITSDGKGGWTVADPKDKAKILALKTDPLVSSVMAGRFTETNRRTLTDDLGRAPTDGELYAAHVLGAAGATKLVRMAEKEPAATAALAFPRAAAANPGLFYGKDGKPTSASELLGRLTGTNADTASRIAQAHATLAADPTRKLDTATLAAVIRAQAAVKVAGDGLAGNGPDAATAGRFARTALGEKSLPGSSRDAVPATGPRVDGWRAKASHDAFSLLMRSDGETLTADAATASGATAETATRPIRFAAADPTPARIGGLAGGIAYVDPSQPMHLLSAATAAEGGRTAATGTTTAITTGGARPSRLMTAAASGAPAMPLPIVDGGTVVRTGRIAVAPTEAAAEARPSGLVAPGAARVKTVSIAPAPAATTGPTTLGAPFGATTPAAAAGARPLLPPVPGETAEAAMPAVPTPAAPARRAAARSAPLDLLGLQRRAAGR